jgi:hypothetical protein
VFLVRIPQKRPVVKTQSFLKLEHLVHNFAMGFTLLMNVIIFSSLENEVQKLRTSKNSLAIRHTDGYILKYYSITFPTKFCYTQQINCVIDLFFMPRACARVCINTPLA